MACPIPQGGHNKYKQLSTTQTHTGLEHVSDVKEKM